ncbi:sulfite exporter TauE/SafE family protein [Halomonas alkalicola]|uniref:sulfite exporter TauE/SafE family protein n=1 Tax=Halomonas alkalicola TaxID=1930622 RepID=UPI00265F5591|nr:sulfite exporter TauE/SafE family protein [Halomonas alkalicola]
MLILSILTLAFAGIVKGAIGSGVPLIVIPILTMAYDIQTAIVVLLLPNLLNNAWQTWHYRRHLLPTRFLVYFALSGGIGVALGTWALVRIDEATLSIAVALTILCYLTLRLSKRKAYLKHSLAERLVFPVGLCGGVLQGAVGMSGPISVAFLNFMRLERRAFIGSISTFFTAITVVQLPALMSLGIVTWPLAMSSAGALLIISAAMPLGGRLGQRLSLEWFDKVVMLMLFAVAIKIIAEELLLT